MVHCPQPITPGSIQRKRQQPSSPAASSCSSDHTPQEGVRIHQGLRHGRRHHRRKTLSFIFFYLFQQTSLDKLCKRFFFKTFSTLVRHYEVSLTF